MVQESDFDVYGIDKNGEHTGNTGEIKTTTAPQANEVFSQSLLETTPVGIIVADRDGLLKSVNNAWEIMFSTSANDVINKENIFTGNSGLAKYSEEFKKSLCGETVKLFHLTLDPEKPEDNYKRYFDC